MNAVAPAACPTCIICPCSRNAELTMQIQADCCAGASERPPRLYRIEAGTPVLVEDSWYAEEEGYVLATIDQPGAYALSR